MTLADLHDPVFLAAYALGYLYGCGVLFIKCLIPWLVWRGLISRNPHRPLLFRRSYIAPAAAPPMAPTPRPMPRASRALRSASVS